MTRGNWQRRVELNENRRSEAKQRKQLTAEKKISKQKAQKLLDALERHNDALPVPWEIHIWCDIMPSDAGDAVVVWDENDEHISSKAAAKRRNRSNSIESCSSSGPRSKSGNEKKKHPRSKESVEVASPEQQGIAALRLCPSQFYSGKCKNRKMGKQKGGCTSAHYSKESKTLADVLNANPETRSSAKTVLALSEAAHPHSLTDDSTAAASDSHSMEMIYYISIPTAKTLESKTNSISECIAETLTKKSCNIGSIVYLAFNGILLFDRYRDGLLLTSDSDLRACLSMEKNVGISSSNSSELAKLLPGQLLEYLLTFLSEPEVAAMSKVCKPWNTEIGKDSANLWRHFLERRGWPVEQKNVDTKLTYRKTFLSHYSAVRDLETVKSGIANVLTKKTTDTTRGEVFSKSFDSSKDAPQYPNFCAGIKIWSPNQVLAAYSYDCTLRLFTTAERSHSSDASDKVCRELVCQNIDPYKNTKKKACQIVDLALDETQIACLCRVREENPIEENVEKEATLILLLTREDFLVSGVSEEKGTLQVIDASQAILNFLLEYDGVDDDQLEFISFISSGGKLDELEVWVSQSMVACGHGLYMIHASWELPGSDSDDDETQPVSPKIFLFSSGAGAIVVMHDVDTDVGVLRLYESRALASSAVTRNNRGSSYGCVFALTTPVSRSLVIGSIDSNGAIHTPTTIEGAPVEEGFTLCDRMKRPMAIVGTHQIVVADALMKHLGNDKYHYMSTISFYCPSTDTSDNASETLELGDNLEVIKLVSFREEHVLVLCRFHKEPVIGVAGHWFGPNDEDNTLYSLYGIIFHTPTKTMIHRVCLLNDLDTFPVTIAVDGGTVAAGLFWKGMVMTGEEVRQVHQKDPTRTDRSQLSSAKAKKKKKKTPKKGGKKDGFARGMSLRG